MRTIPVVAVTAYTDDSSRERAFEVGMSEVLTKPVSAEELERCLELYFFK